MEFVIGFATGLLITITTLHFIPKIRSSKKRHPVLDRISASPLTTAEKPQNQYSDYTVEELEQRKKRLEKDYKYHVDWPILRQSDAREIKEILNLLEWHYDQNGTREYLKQKEKTQRELAEFDAKYQAVLKGNS